MKNVIVSIQNGLLSEAIARILYESGEFKTYRVPVNHLCSVVNDCIALAADILLMEVSCVSGTTIDERISEGIKVKEKMPDCKIALLCDENSNPGIAHQVVCAKKQGVIDSFFYSSITGSYLTAVLDSL